MYEIPKDLVKCAVVGLLLGFAWVLWVADASIRGVEVALSHLSQEVQR